MRAKNNSGSVVLDKRSGQWFFYFYEDGKRRSKETLNKFSDIHGVEDRVGGGGQTENETVDFGDGERV
jgi:hypothetical protein